MSYIGITIDAIKTRILIFHSAIWRDGTAASCHIAYNSAKLLLLLQLVVQAAVPAMAEAFLAIKASSAAHSRGSI